MLLPKKSRTYTFEGVCGEGDVQTQKSSEKGEEKFDTLLSQLKKLVLHAPDINIFKAEESIKEKQLYVRIKFMSASYIKKFTR